MKKHFLFFLTLFLLSYTVFGAQEFVDTFNRGDSATVGNGWVESDSANAPFSVESQMFKQYYNGGSSPGVYMDHELNFSQGDYFSMTLMTTNVNPSAGSLPFSAYFQNSSDCWTLKIEAGSFKYNGNTVFAASNNAWYNITIKNYSRFTNSFQLYKNDTLLLTGNASCVPINFRFLNNPDFVTYTTYVDMVGLWNTSVGFPQISGTNCTSCNAPLGDTSPPYTTADTTPTFTFSTDTQANCRLARTNISYSDMGSSRDCSSGEGTVSHTCTLGVADELVFPFDMVYATCTSTLNPAFQGNASFQMGITDLEANQSQAMLDGIHASLIWPGASVFANQQVYLVTTANTHLLKRVDYVAMYGSQMWLFNYENTSAIGLFNMTPAVYVLDMVNISLTEIKNRVETLINSTKQ